MGNIQIYMMIYLNENSFRFRYNIKDPVHGPYRRPMKPLFIEIQNFWAWADKFWGIWGIFGQTISTHFGTVSPLSMLSINQPLFLQTTMLLYLHPKYLFGIRI